MLTRKVVSVLFADLAGSTALGERLDPEPLRNVLNRYFELARGCIERHGGTTEKFIGDAVMAVFGIPVSHDDDALRALRAASDMRAEIEDLNRELERDLGVSLSVRIGVNTGEVVTGTEERLATGDAVNVAARLEQAAAAGEILVGESTLRLARAAVETEPAGPVAAKGKTEPVPAHRLLRVVEGAAAFERRDDAPLTGRDQEMAALHAEFELAIEQRGCRLVTVLAPPGIGKTRLVRELGGAVRNAADVLTGRCLPYGDGITYWPLLEIFRAAGAEADLAEALGDVTPEEIAWSVRKLLEARARERPLVLIVEDLHWAEPALLDLLEHLAQWTRDAPLLLLCNARPEFLDDRPRWGGATIALPPLGGEDAEALIAALSPDPLPQAMRERIAGIAEGNPLFVEQLIAMASEGGSVDEVPPTIQALIAARLDALPQEQRAIVEHASVVGVEFEWDALAELAPDGSRPSGAVLAALARRELIQPHDTVPDSFRFRHVLIRDAAYERMAKQLRAELHERFADRLERSGDELEEIAAYHLEQAHRMLAGLGAPPRDGPSLAERAAAHLDRCGRRAAARGDASAAAGLMGRAIGLYQPGDERRMRLLAPAGRAIMDAGDLDGAERLLSEAASAPAPEVAAEAALDLALVHLWQDPGGRSHAEAWAAIERAIPLYERAGAAGPLARARTAAGMLRFWSGQCDAAIAELEEALRHASADGDPSLATDAARCLLSAHLWGTTPVADALVAVDRLAAPAERSLPLRIMTLAVRGELEAMGGDAVAGRRLCADATALAEELGVAVHKTRTAHHAGMVELLAGDPAAAEAILLPALEDLERQRNWGAASSFVPRVVTALVAQGRIDEAVARSEFPLHQLIAEDVDANATVRSARALALARAGDLDTAERLAREAAAVAAPTDYLGVRADAHVALAEVLSARQRPADAAAERRRAVELYARKGNVAAVALLTNGPLH